MKSINEILHQRAVALAEKITPMQKIENGLQVIEFELGGELYGIESHFMQKTYSLNDLTFLPCVPAFVMGIINVRGQIISVIDLRKILGLPDRGITDLKQVILLRSKSMEFAILADKVIGMRRIDLNHLQTSLATLNATQNSYLKGITLEQLVILDAEKLLSDVNLVVNEQVGTST